MAMSTNNPTWTVDRLVPGGDGMARTPDGRAAFVPGGLPGDLIRPLGVRERRRHVTVERWELVEPGPDRRSDLPCPLAGRCGGCDWMALEPDAQLKAKGAVLRDALRRIGGLELEVADPEQIGSDLGYRTRLRLHPDRSGYPGLYERGSHRVVAVPRCPVAHDAINDGLARLRNHLACLPNTRELELRAAPIGHPVAAAVYTGPAWFPWRDALVALAQEYPVLLDGEPLGAPPDQAWPLPGGLELRVPMGDFVQVNPAVNRVLVEAVVHGARQRSAATFVDLYCGAGNFSLSLLSLGLTGVGIEISKEACEVAARNAREAGLEGRFLAGDAAQRLARLELESAPDLLVLDPPRTGAKEVVPAIAALSPAHVAYVSCDPATLARDLRALGERGYEVVEVRAFDMFPQTHHVEALAWLRRVQGSTTVA